MRPGARPTQASSSSFGRYFLVLLDDSSSSSTIPIMSFAALCTSLDVRQLQAFAARPVPRSLADAKLLSSAETAFFVADGTAYPKIDPQKRNSGSLPHVELCRGAVRGKRLDLPATKTPATQIS